MQRKHNNEESVYTRLGCNVVCGHSRKLRFKGFGLIHSSHTITQTIKTTEAVVDQHPVFDEVKLRFL